MSVMGLIDSCLVRVGEPPKWTVDICSKTDQVVYCGLVGKRDCYGLVRWKGNKTVLPMTWFESTFVGLADTKPFFREGRVLVHPAIGPVVLVEREPDCDTVTVRRVRWPWFWLGRWYRLRRRVMILRSWLEWNRRWLRENW